MVELQLYFPHSIYFAIDAIQALEYLKQYNRKVPFPRSCIFRRQMLNKTKCKVAPTL